MMFEVKLLPTSLDPFLEMADKDWKVVTGNKSAQIILVAKKGMAT